MKEATRLPADWWPDPVAYARAVERNTHIDVERETRRFVERMTRARTTRKDWTATWRGTLIARNDEIATLPVIYAELVEPEPDDPILPANWRPDPMTIETLGEVFPSINISDQLEKFLAEYRGKPLSAARTGGNTSPCKSWTSAFRVWAKEADYAQRMEWRRWRYEGDRRQVESMTVRQRGSLRLIAGTA